MTTKLVCPDCGSDDLLVSTLAVGHADFFIDEFGRRDYTLTETPDAIGNDDDTFTCGECGYTGGLGDLYPDYDRQFVVRIYHTGDNSTCCLQGPFNGRFAAEKVGRAKCGEDDTHAFELPFLYPPSF